MANKNKKNSGKKSNIFTRETIGMTVLLFTTVILFILFTGSSVLQAVGAGICTLLYGTFGYGVYFIVALLYYFGVWLVSEKKIKIRAGVALSISACVIMIFFLFHAVTTRNIALTSFGEYINANYMSAAEGWSGYTFGGVVCGLVVYPVAKLTTFIGAYVIFSVLFVLCTYWAFVMLFKGKLSAKKAAKVTEVNSEDLRPAEPAPTETVAAPAYRTEEAREVAAAAAVEPQYVAPQQPAYVEQPQPKQEDDRYSQRNLGRKILFENGEFAAESYRRNMIFNEDSYFNHPVSSESDYLSSFSSNPSAYRASAAKSQSYTQDYQDEVEHKPVAETPSSYVYGEDPVKNLDDCNVQTDYQSDDSDYSGYGEETAESYAQSIRQDEPYIEQPRQRIQEEPTVEQSRQNVEPEPPVRERDIFSERTRFTQSSDEENKQSFEQTAPAEPAQEPPKNEGKSSSLLSSIFNSDSVRGNDSIPVGRNRDEQRIVPREETSKQDLFDDDEVDLGEDRFGVSSRLSSDRTERIDRTDRDQRIEPSVTPSSEEREVGFKTASDRRSGLEESGVGFTAPAERRGVPAEPPKAAETPKPEEKPVEKPKHVWKKYVRPSLDLLDDYPENNNVNTGEIEENKHIIVETLSSFKIACSISDVVVGPAITRYDVIIEDKLNIKRSLNYKDAIAMELKKDNINAYLNFAKGALSIEVPNNHRAVVGLKTMLANPKFFNSKPNALTFGLGKNVEGEVVCPDITKMPHLLVAGTTGSGKSICLSTLLISLLYKYGPEDLRLILVDPKQVEFISYDKLPHLMINEIIYDVDKAIKALNWANKEMERRYTLFKEMTENGIATKNLDEYNSHLPDGEEKLPKIVIILDEFGDLMLQAKKDIENRIIKLVQKARACGIHLILATQRPSVDCITGLIKSNLPTRIGFKVNSFADSSTIFDVGGAEKLLGRGDMYFRSTENPELTRIQGCFVDTHEVQRVTDFIKANNETYFDEDVSDFINKVEETETAASMGGGGDMSEDGGDAKIDDTFIKALYFCVTSNMASVSMIQRRFPVGYIKACKIIDWMENMNYVTPSEGSKPRKVLLSKDEFINIYGEIDD